jgi:hypothetical protein
MSAAPKKPTRKSGRARKAAGDAPVFTYYARLSGEQKALASRLDLIVARNAPGVTRAIKWNVPFYGLKGKGWFCAFAAFKNHTSLNFFLGVKLKPAPKDGGVRENRRVVYRTLADVDEAQLASWVRQAAAIPGWLAPPSRGGL